MVAASVPEPPPTTQPADNSYCFACHMNYQRESLAAGHQRAGVGCTRCHGESDRHSTDENNVTPPDIMFPKERLNDACLKCHAPEKLLARGDEKAHAALLAGKGDQDPPGSGATQPAREIGKKYCTDCHGQHALNVRTRLWDKKTGRLIADDGVRMVESRPSGETPSKPDGQVP
jgi:hypothetical protein